MRASIKMIGVSNLQSFIASMTQKLTLSHISDESKFFFQAEDGIRDLTVTGSSDVCSSDLADLKELSGDEGTVREVPTETIGSELLPESGGDVLASRLGFLPSTRVVVRRQEEPRLLLR